MMKKLSLTLAVVAALATVVVPVAPAQAATDRAATSPAARHRAIADHAERGNAAILSKAQMQRLKRSDPALYAKLYKAHTTGTIPVLTAAEQKHVKAMSDGNLKQFRAGSPSIGYAAAGGTAFSTGFWIVLALTIVVLLLIIASPAARLAVAKFFENLFSLRWAGAR